LAVGLILGIIFGNPFRSYSQKASRLLLQFCVVCLGFGMSLHEVVRVGKSGFVYTALGISFAMLAGTLLGRLLAVDKTNAFLVSVGTAICGGSAIAAVGKVIDASDEQMTVSLGTVFVLNSVGLLVFPAIGAALGLTQTQFGLWAALAIHDTSSVVGAGAKYGLIALTVATTVKLGRALWILPMSVVTAAVRRTKSRIQYPWFILFFVLAALLNSYAPAGKHLYASLAVVGKIGLTVTLYLIGANISLSALKTIGIRPLLQGVLLWIAVASLSLLLIRAGLIRL
jgi:uncharacterized integral membrane protein (TIGR00698 family)